MIPAAIMSAGSLLSSVGSLFGGDKNDPARLAKNAQAFQLALQGDANARQFLEWRTGQHDPQTTMIPGYGQVGGWATGTAKADANAKWQQLNVQQTVSGLATQAGQVIAPVLAPAVNQAKAETTRNVIIVAAIAVGVVLYFRHRS